CVEACGLLQSVQVPGVEVFVEPVREHRFVAVFRGEGLGDRVNDTDPQVTGQAPPEAGGEDETSRRAAEAGDGFVARGRGALSDRAPTNGLTLRGLAKHPKVPSMAEVYGVRAAALAVYPMYRGLARLVGMDVIDAGASLGDQVEALGRLWRDYD